MLLSLNDHQVKRNSCYNCSMLQQDCGSHGIHLSDYHLLAPAAGGRYPAPLQVLYVLDEQYGNSTNSSVVFSEKNGGCRWLISVLY